MLNFIKTFRADEDGAVTVDWVVLTAAIVGLAIAIFTTMFDNVREIATDINNELDGVATTGVNTTLGTP